jgi:hypothetical protein
MSPRIAIVLFVLILAPAAGAEELLLNTDFGTNIDEWVLWWGDERAGLWDASRLSPDPAGHGSGNLSAWSQ